MLDLGSGRDKRRGEGREERWGNEGLHVGNIRGLRWGQQVGYDLNILHSYIKSLKNKQNIK